MKKIKIVELFAGVGGFRHGLEKANKNIFKTVWVNQWEPKATVQHAFKCYVEKFGAENVSNIDIAKAKKNVPDHDLLVGGFPCQDYSVATTKAQGIKGAKGVLWWEIRDIIEFKQPKYILLENVDRLIKSPTKQRGRDFAVMLKCLSDLNYTVEWRVVNAADYGFSQRRKRVFIFAQKKSIKNNKLETFLEKHTLLTKSFPILGIKTVNKQKREIHHDISNLNLDEISKKFNGRFWNSGIMFRGKIYSVDVLAKTKEPKTLKQIISKSHNVSENFFLNQKQIEKIKLFKKGRKIQRITKEGHKYTYSEGSMCFPENLSKPSRTILTSETSLSRTTHVIKDLENNKLRFLTPEETEQLNGFPIGWTNSLPLKTRYFTMGNALVCDLVKMVGKELLKFDSKKIN